MAVFLFASLFGTAAIYADSFTYSPDTLTFTPTSQDSVIQYVRIAYNGDSTGPGTHIHAWISDGSSYFGCPTDTVFTKSYIYLRVAYKPQTSAVHGTLSISDDSVTRTVLLIGNALPTTPALTAEGPYFPSIPEGHDTCEQSYYGLRLINTTSSPDTIHSLDWSHNPNGIFTWDSVSLPYILGAYDTAYWTVCFHAPDNTTENIDTLVVYYGSGDAHVSRVVEGTAITNDGTLSAVGPYFPEHPIEGADTCVKMTLINTSSGTDTIQRVAWGHNSDVFSWDSTKVPFTLGAHDTTYLTFCYHAPDNTETYTDTVLVSYSDASGSQWLDSRIVSATAVTNDDELSAVGPYFPENTPEGKDTCVSMRLVNNGSGIDTVESINWAHNPNGIFNWDSTTVPFTLGAHDTTNLTFCYDAPDNTTTYIDTLTIRYNDANGSAWYDTRIVYATAVDTNPPDGELTAVGPYFPDVVDEGHDTCTTMRLVNTGSDLDTITGESNNTRTGWTHDPNGIFTWDSVSLPATLGSHDTTYWTFCFHAPNDTNLYVDTFNIYYHDAYSQTRSVSRIVSGKATDPSITTCYGLYAATFATTNVGDTTEETLYIHNNLKNATSLTSIHISGTDDGAFRVDSANFPLTIDSNAYGYVTLKFIPARHDGSDEYTATLTANFSTTDTTHCREATVSLVGYMPQSCSDTATEDVDTTGTADVDISGDSASSYAHRIDIVNNTSETVIVSAVKFIDSSSHFYIYQTVPGVPDTLVPGAGMAVIIHFYGDTGQAYYDTLAITITNGITHGGKYTPLAAPGTMLISVKGTQTSAPASVNITAQSGLNVMLYPNPSSGLVNMELDGATSATFQIFDILGNVIASHVGSGTWQFDATASGLSNGTYFIRASSGESVATKRFVLQR